MKLPFTKSHNVMQFYELETVLLRVQQTPAMSALYMHGRNCEATDDFGCVVDLATAQ